MVFIDKNVKKRRKSWKMVEKTRKKTFFSKRWINRLPPQFSTDVYIILSAVERFWMGKVVGWFRFLHSLCSVEMTVGRDVLGWGECFIRWRAWPGLRSEEARFLTVGVR